MHITIAADPVTWKELEDVVIVRVPVTFTFARGERPPLVFGAQVDKVSAEGEDLQAVPERTRLYVRRSGRTKMMGDVHSFQLHDDESSEVVYIEAHFHAAQWRQGVGKVRRGSLEFRIRFRRNLSIPFQAQCEIDGDGRRIQFGSVTRRTQPLNIWWNAAGIVAAGGVLAMFNLKNTDVIWQPPWLTQGAISVFFGSLLTFIGINIARVRPLLVTFEGWRSLFAYPEVHLGHSATEFLESRTVSRVTGPAVVAMALLAFLAWPVRLPTLSAGEWRLAQDTVWARIEAGSRIHRVIPPMPGVVQLHDPATRIVDGAGRERPVVLATWSGFGKRSRELVVTRIGPDGEWYPSCLKQQRTMRDSMSDTIRSVMQIEEIRYACEGVYMLAFGRTSSAAESVRIIKRSTDVTGVQDSIWIAPRAVVDDAVLAAVAAEWNSILEQVSLPDIRKVTVIDDLARAALDRVGVFTIDTVVYWKAARSWLDSLHAELGRPKERTHQALKLEALTALRLKDGQYFDRWEVDSMAERYRQYYVAEARDSIKHIGNADDFKALTRMLVRLEEVYPEAGDVVRPAIHRRLEEQNRGAREAGYTLEYLHAAAEVRRLGTGLRLEFIKQKLRGVDPHYIRSALETLDRSSLKAYENATLDSFASPLTAVAGVSDR